MWGVCWVCGLGRWWGGCSEGGSGCEVEGFRFGSRERGEKVFMECVFFFVVKDVFFGVDCERLCIGFGSSECVGVCVFLYWLFFVRVCGLLGFFLFFFVIC